jgi:hypothetical protein
MNRIFGTRFGDSATRCTDGVWISYSFLNGIHIICLDCEGLFSSQRKEIEEIKMLSFLTGFSDFTYLNTDLTFNRYQSQLISNLNNSVTRLKGENFFKGKLIWTLRDISDDTKSGAWTEFEGHLESKEGIEFIKNIFGGEFNFVCLNNFKHHQFSTEIYECRNDVIEDKICKENKGITHWKSTKNLIRCMKIVLIQLFMDDDSDLESEKEEYMINEMIKNFTEIWNRMDKYQNDTKIKSLNFEINKKTLK